MQVREGNDTLVGDGGADMLLEGLAPTRSSSTKLLQHTTPQSSQP
jgi:hypothetical protein